MSAPWLICSRLSFTVLRRPTVLSVKLKLYNSLAGLLFWSLTNTNWWWTIILSCGDSNGCDILVVQSAGRLGIHSMIEKRSGLVSQATEHLRSSSSLGRPELTVGSVQHRLSPG